MTRLALACTLLAMTLAPAANAQLATTRMFNFVDTPAALTYNASGQAQVQLHPTAGSIIRIAGFRKVSIRIGSTHATSVLVNMGKLANATLSQIFTYPTDQQIHTFDIIGPELAVTLMGGAPGSTENVQLWVFLSS
jgi:hypothetical protein